MKVMFKNLIQGYTGKADDYVIYYNRRLNCVIMRERPVYRNHPAQSPFRAVMKNLKALNPSQAYRRDAAAYVEQYNKLPASRNCILVSWANLYQRIMWMMKRVMPEVDLAALNKEQILLQELPCKSIKAAVDAGLIPRVRGYGAWDSEI